MGRKTRLEERMLMVELSRTGHPDREIAKQLGWSVFTVRKWRGREKREGRPGFASVMGRPVGGVLGTFPPRLIETLRGWREAHPGWGAKTLWAELKADERFGGQALPSVRSIARFLKAEGLVRPYERHNELPTADRVVPQAPHEVWELDAKGWQEIPDIGAVSLINLNDRSSHVRLLSYPLPLKRGKTADYQLVLRLAFTEWGLPDQLATDRDSVFHDNTAKSPFPTRLHLWLLALGVHLSLGRPNCPTDQAMTERSHQLWDRQLLAGQHFADWDTLYYQSLNRRDFLNYHLPCTALGNQPPLVACPQALTPRRLYRPEWEPDLLDLSRIYAFLTKGRWFRQTGKGGVLAIGAKFYTLGQAWQNRQVEIIFDPTDNMLVFFSPDAENVKRLPIKGITHQDLMGEMSPILTLPVFQLALPFSWDEWRLTRLCGTLLTRLIGT